MLGLNTAEASEKNQIALDHPLVVSQVGTSNQVTEDIGMQQTSHAVSGTVTVAAMEVKING